LKLETFPHRGLIFNQGDPGDSFYIIHDGRVGIYISEKSKIGSGEQQIKVAELKNGNSFGELALLYGQPRAATAVSLEITELIVLSKDGYDKVIRSVQSEQINANFTFLKSLVMFREVSDETIKYFSKIATLRKFPPHTTIISQDEKPRGIYFIYSGSVKLLRKIEFNESEAGDLTTMAETPKTSQGVSTVSIVIDELEVGDCFCDYAYLNKEAVQFSAICTLPCKIFLLNKDDFSRFTKEELEEFRLKTRPYPCDAVLRKQYLELQRWNIFKKQYLKNIRLERDLKKM
jgi:CRP-like cAMP-binding protein